MKRKNTSSKYCVFCRTRSNNGGITAENGAHICLACAELIHNIVDPWYQEMLLNECGCHSCYSHVDIDED